MTQKIATDTALEKKAHGKKTRSIVVALWRSHRLGARGKCWAWAKLLSQFPRLTYPITNFDCRTMLSAAASQDPITQRFKNFADVPKKRPRDMPWLILIVGNANFLICHAPKMARNFSWCRKIIYCTRGRGPHFHSAAFPPLGKAKNKIHPAQGKVSQHCNTKLKR